MPEAIQDLIDINELSRRISIPKGTIYNWVYLKRIPFVKAGRSLRFDPDEVIRPMPHCAKSEKAGLRDDEWRTIRGA
jgi:excisionase family DNA binding protein